MFAMSLVTHVDFWGQILLLLIAYVHWHCLEMVPEMLLELGEVDKGHH